MPKRSFSEFKDENKVNAWSEKNEFKAHEVSIFSREKAIFKCYNEDCGHEFKSRIDSISRGSWCPFCSKNRRLCGEKSCIPCRKKSFVSFHDKDKVNAWSSKNKFKPYEVTISSNKKAIFKCYNGDCGHEFESEIGHVTTGVWCPFCSKFNRKLCGEKSCIPCRKNSFVSFHDKDKVNAWSSKNKFKPYEVTIFSGEKAIFKCYNGDCGHEFESEIGHVTADVQWCPFCSKSNRKLCGEKSCIPCRKNSFVSFYDKDKVNAWSSKNKFKPYEVTIYSGQKAIFECYKCTHEFKSKINHVTDGHWCPFCSKSNRKLCGEKSCKLCVKNSFASFHDKNKVNSWSNKNEMESYQVTISSSKKYIFECYKCGHEFKSSICNISKGNWCPCCYISLKY